MPTVADVRERTQFPILIAALVAVAVLGYGPFLALPFIGDDYVFIDQGLRLTFKDLLSPSNTQFGWYRPWSREIHFFTLLKLFGSNEVAFRAASFGLWLAALGIYGAILARIASWRTAVVATLGASTLGLWGAPFLWISGAQDLWMLVFALATLMLFAQGRFAAATLTQALALMSKESAAVVPCLVTAYAVLMNRVSWKTALRQTWPLWATLFVWIAVHPTLRDRMRFESAHTLETEHRPSLLVGAARTFLSTINLDAIPRPVEIGTRDVALALTSIVVLWATVLRLVSRGRGPNLDEKRATLVRFGLLWALLGWLPMLVPTIGWHAYYGCFGALGAWLVVAIVLDGRRALVIATLSAMIVLRTAAAASLSWDWGSVWYQKRAGYLLSAIHERLLAMHPTVPPNTRFYFGRIPNNIGLIAGGSPAVRVWYRDTTLAAEFYSAYRPRRAEERSGPDLFFRFDSLQALVEVTDHIPIGADQARAWEADQLNLAMLMLRAGDMKRAGHHFAVLSALPHRPEAAIYAGVSFGRAGMNQVADSLLREGARRNGISSDSVETWARDLDAAMPVPGSNP